MVGRSFTTIGCRLEEGAKVYQNAEACPLLGHAILRRRLLVRSRRATAAALCGQDEAAPLRVSWDTRDWWLRERT